MNLRHAYRPWLAIVLLIMVASLSAGCSKSPTKPVPVLPIPQADADDIAQLVATTLSADNGGWYCLIKSYAESLSVPAPAPTLTSTGERWSVPLSSGNRIRNDFSLTKGRVTYLLQAGWIRGDGSKTTVRDTASRDLEALVSADAGEFRNVNGIQLGTYGCHTYTLDSPNDSTFFAGNLAASDPDTVEFSGFLDDSSFALVNSTIRAGSARLWYLKNFVDYTLRIPKSKLVSSPYPVGDISEIHWNIEAYGLNASQSRTDFGFGELVEARITFNGTANAVLLLADVTTEPTWFYRYSINLNTGQIARLP